MSDQEDDFMCEDVEDYGLEYSEDSNSEPDVDLENQYYNSKALKEDEPQAALASFQKVLDLEAGEKGEWGFKALKQMIKINFKLNNFGEMMVRYKQLLTYIKSAVTRNHSEKSINSILDYISTSKNMELLQDFYETTLEALKDAKNDRLWFKTNTKLGKLYFDRNDFTKLAKILKQLHQSCQTDDGEDDLKKGTQLLEIYALEIQMYTAQKNNKKLKTLYEQSLHIKSAIPHPLIMGVIRECGGKMHLREGEFEKAHTDFFEAFKNYDESGSPRRTTCLKYLVLANMLMKSDINPFDSQEAKPYKNDPEILAMTNLVNAYQTNDINEFESILKQNRQNIMDDPFIREHIEDLLRNIRTQVLIKLIKPYTRINIPFISRELNIDVSEVENLLVSCILDSTIRGRIDQVNHVLFLDQTSVNASSDESQPVPSGLQSNPGPSGTKSKLKPEPSEYDSDSDCDMKPVRYCSLYRTSTSQSTSSTTETTQGEPGCSDMERNTSPGPSGLQPKPGPSGLQHKPGPSTTQPKPGPSGVQRKPGPYIVKACPGPSGIQFRAGPSDLQQQPGASRNRPRSSPATVSPAELRQRLNPRFPIRTHRLPKPALLEPVAVLLHHAVNVRNQRHLLEKDTNYATLGHVTGRLFHHCFDNMFPHMRTIDSPGEEPGLHRSTSNFSFGSSDDSIEMPLEDEFVIAEIRYQPLDHEIIPNTIGVRNEVRIPLPAPPVDSLNSFQQTLMRKRNRRYGRALFRNTSTIVDTLRHFIPHICRTISILLQNFDILTDTRNQQRPLRFTGSERGQLGLPQFEYQYAHCQAIMRQTMFDENPSRRKKLQTPNQRELFIFTHIINAIARVLPYLLKEMFADCSNRDVENNIKKMLEAYFRQIYMPERPDARDSPTELHHNEDALRRLYGRVFRGSNIGVQSRFTDISHVLILGLDEILQYIN